MLISKTVKIKWNNYTKKHYENKGYKFSKLGEEFEVKVEDLTPGSSAIIKCRCDYCNKIIEKSYSKYYRTKQDNNKKDCCKKCINKKLEENNLKKYGTKYPLQNQTSKNIIQQKMKNTSLERYGYEYATQSNIIRQKTINTNLQKYGCKYVLQNKEIRKKINNTNLLRYNHKYVLKNKEIRQKIKNTNLERYGYECVLKNKEIQQKIKNTNLQKYGVSNTWECKEIHNKAMIHANITMYKNGTGPKSKQQIYICNLLNGKLNYPVSRCKLDIAFPKEMIYIEYDGGGHNLSVIYGDMTIEEFKKREIKRQKYLKKYGWKIIRIISSKDILPQDDDMIKLINKAKQYLINSNHTWVEIDIDKNEYRCCEYVKKLN